MKKNVLTSEFSHETNTFVESPTTILNFSQYTLLEDENEIKMKHFGKKTSIGSTYEMGEKYNWNVISAVEAVANPSGKLTEETFEYILGKILTKATQFMNNSNENNIDGVILHLHGAMVTINYEDAEGEILYRLKKILQPNTPIIVTLDLHGNITNKMVENSTTLIAVRTYPHIDFYERGIQAANLLQQILNGEVHPITAICKPPIIGGCDGGRTQIGPMVELLSRGDQLELNGDALVVSICSGFTASDIYDIGPSVTVTVDALKYKSNNNNNNNNNSLNFIQITLNNAQLIANSLGEYIWYTKEFCSLDILTIKEATQLAKETENNDIDNVNNNENNNNEISKSINQALIIADVSDNPGSGHYGDSTDLLASLVQCNLTRPSVFFAIYDPDAVQQGYSIGLGNQGYITLGGKCAPHLGGGPLRLFGIVSFLGISPESQMKLDGPMSIHVHPTGPCMRFTVNNNFDICVQSNNGQPYDIGQITAFGCNISLCRTIVLKSKHHFRAHFQSISRQIVTVDGGGLGSVVLKGGGTLYKNVRRPIWPLDEINSYP